MPSIYDDELCHHGVKGQKWGVRRYQPYPSDNSGGKMIGLAAKRANTYGGKKNKNKNNEERNPINAITNNLRSASNIARKKTSIEAKKQADKEIQEEDISSMSDDELRKRVNRMNLERQYTQLKEEQIKRGKTEVADILDIAGDITGIAASIVTVVVAANKLRKASRYIPIK